MKNADPFVGTRYIKDVTWDTNNIARKGQTPIISPRLLVKPTAYARSAGLAAYSGVVGIIYSSLVLPAATPVAVVLAVGTGMRATNQLGEAGFTELLSLKTNGKLKNQTLAINTQGMKDQYMPSNGSYSYG